MKLSSEDKNWLLNLSRTAITLLLETGKKITVNENIVPSSTKEKVAVFVTLEVKGKLHGCIGNIEPRSHLYLAVIENALSAAFDDPRFPEITNNDLKDLSIEISVLSNFAQINGTSNNERVSKIRPGKDGVILENGNRKAVFLPQVWVELPQKEDFLTHLSHKAGLTQAAWKLENTQFTTFQIESFSSINPLTP